MNNPGASAQAIQYHYDIGNEFYKLWLDDSLSYSCALWDHDERYEDLGTAQLRKIDFHIQQARAEGAQRILDVGCGWGGTLKRLVECYACKEAIGLTLSNAQKEWIDSLKIPGANVKLESWSDHRPNKPYDGIISVGAFEHFSKPEDKDDDKISNYRNFFSLCHQWLKPNGRISLQTITYGNARRQDFSQFIAAKIFPETEFPKFSEIVAAVERIFEIENVRNDRADYALTCRAWLKKIKSNRPAIVDVAGERLVSDYEDFLRESVFSFEMGTMDLFRIVLRRIDEPR